MPTRRGRWVRRGALRGVRCAARWLAAALCLAALCLAALAACGEEPPPRAASDGAAALDFDPQAYAAVISGPPPATTARLTSPTQDGTGRVQVQVDRRPEDDALRVAVTLHVGPAQLELEVIEVGGLTYVRGAAGGASQAWIAVDSASAREGGADVPALASAFPVVGGVAAAVQDDGWAVQADEPCPGGGACFVLTNPDYEFASLYVDARSYRPLHLRLARPGMQAAGEIEVDWGAAAPIRPPADARRVDAAAFTAALTPILRALGL